MFPVISAKVGRIVLKSKEGKGVCLTHGATYGWEQGLSSVPDVPHAANVSFVTEGSGVGVSKEPPVNVKVVSANSCHGYIYSDHLTSSESQTASNLCFQVRVAEGVDIAWETIFVNNKLFVEVPNTILPEGSKESLVSLLEYAEENMRKKNYDCIPGLVSLLEYAEEELDCVHVILCFKKARNDRANLIRAFMFLGFRVVTPGDPIVPNVEDLMFLVYTIDNYDSD